MRRQAQQEQRQQASMRRPHSPLPLLPHASAPAPATPAAGSAAPVAAGSSGWQQQPRPQQQQQQQQHHHHHHHHHHQEKQGGIATAASSSWRSQLHRALRGKLFTLANLWTCAIVGTLLLALIFRAMQPTDEPSVSVLHHEWELDPANDEQVQLAVLDLDVRGVGRYTLNFQNTTLAIRKPPPPPKGEKAKEQGQEQEKGKDSKAAEMGIVLAEVAIPGWQLRLAQSNVVVSATQPSPFIPYQPDTVPELVLTAVFDGVVSVFASLPSRIFLTCRLKASVLSEEPPVCDSYYVSHIQKG